MENVLLENVLSERHRLRKLREVVPLKETAGAETLRHQRA